MSGSSFRTALTLDSWTKSPSFFLNSSFATMAVSPCCSTAIGLPMIVHRGGNSGCVHDNDRRRSLRRPFALERLQLLFDRSLTVQVREIGLQAGGVLEVRLGGE